MDVSGGNFESLSTVKLNVRRLDPFWASRLWQKLIKEVKSNVRISKQRHFLKNYENVFNGEDMVNVILNYLKMCSELDVEKIERTNAVKVCQVLMDKRLFESVVSKGNIKFEDSSYKLYRFIDDDVITNKNAMEKEDIQLDIPEEEKENVFQSPCSLNSNTHESGKSLSFKRSTTRSSFRFKTPLMKVRETKPSPVRFSKRKIRDIDQEAAFLELRETALAVILQFVDIPVLESVLDVPADLPELPETPQPFVLENDFTPRKMKPLKHNFQGPIVDIPWIRAASECLGGGLPPGLSGLWSVQACKVLCYKSVGERFSCSVESIIPGEYFSICTAVVKMLKEDCRQRALYVLQLLMFYLPIKRRHQLQSLLQFLNTVVEDLFVSVDKQLTNYEAVIQDFMSVVFKHPLVSDDTQKILFDFLLLKVNSVFSVPSTLWRIKDSGITLCKKLSSEELQSFMLYYTRNSLIDLATSVVDSTDIKLADKKTWLKKLKKHHTDIYNICHFTE